MLRRAKDGDLPGLEAERTVKQSFDEWLSNRRAQNYSHTTLNSDAWHARLVAQFFGADTRLRQIAARPQTIRDFHQWMANEQDLGASATNSTLRMLHGLLKLRGCWTAALQKLWTVSKQSSRSSRGVISEAAFLALDCAAWMRDADSLMRWMYPLARFTGMRAAEVLHLRLRGFRLEANPPTLQVEIAARRTEKGLDRGTKTDAGERAIPLNDDALAAARGLLGRNDRLCAASNVKPSPEHFVLPYRGKEKGSKRWNFDRPSATHCEWRGLLHDASRIEPEAKAAKLHDLRHTACTLAIEAGVPIELCRAYYGWSRDEMARYYSHIRVAKLADVAAAIAPKPEVEEEEGNRPAAPAPAPVVIIRAAEHRPRTFHRGAPRH